MSDFFITKSRISDFKNSKAFWRFYSAHIPIKSYNKQGLKQINLKINEDIITELQVLSNYFNHFLLI